MSTQGFFRRWARLKSGGGSGPEPAPARSVPAPDPLAGFEPLAETAPHPPATPVPPAPPAGRERKAPTLEDAALLGPDSDFSAFVSQGVDKEVQRLAMKKLFADPRFNVMDGLDVYIDDFTTADPVPAAMLASLQHARSVFAKLLGDDKNEGEPGHEANERPPNPDPPSQGNA